MSAIESAASVEESLYVDGAWTDAAAGGRFDVTDPATGELVGTAADARAADVARAIDAAAAALDGWRETPARERGRLLLRSAELVRERAGEIARLMTREQGKPLAESTGEVEYAASFFEWFAGEAERVYGQVVPAQRPDQRAIVLRAPVGVAVAITPWNFPAAMLTRKLGPALAAGCPTIVKPASATPLTAAAVLRCVEDAGAPPGLVNLVTSRSAGEVSETLFGDPRVRKVSFTGSTSVGQELIRLSATNVTRLSLELGGHAPTMIFADANLDDAVADLITSKFRNAGQTCVCANRAFVQREVYDEVLERLTGAVGDLVVGHGLEPSTTIGPLINGAAADTVAAHVEDATANGARLLAGGDRLQPDGLDGPGFFAPTLLADATPEMLISREETFGPALAISPFESEDEVVARANDTEYGLAAYVHTRDYGRVLRVAERLDFGVIGVDAGLVAAANVPFGGVKASGYGTEGGAFGIEEFLDVKYVLLGRVAPQ